MAGTIKQSGSKIQALEGLRGWLAMWVVVTHLFQFSGHTRLDSPILGLLANGHHAVKVFMILSGFVIALLIDKNPEPYGPYLRRRFLRIYPVFLIGALAGIMVHGLRGDLLHGWWPAFFDEKNLSDYNASWNAYDSNLFAYAASMLTMMNGVIPNAILPYVATAFNGVVWSLSLEFQFYLAAPLLCLALSPLKTRIVPVCFGIFVVMVVRHAVFPASNGMPWSTHGAFLPFNIEWFVFGILSFHLWTGLKDVLRTIPHHANLLTTCAAVLLLLSGSDARQLAKGHLEGVIGEAIPLVIWVLVLAHLLDQQSGAQNWLNRLFGKLLESPPVLFMGRISYSIYLLHNPIIILVQWGIVRHLGIQNWVHCFIVTSLIAIPATILVSALSYHYVEQFFTRMGKSSRKREPALTQMAVRSPAAISTDGPAS